MNADCNHFRSPSAHRLWDRANRDAAYSKCEFFEFLSAESRGHESLAAEIANGCRKFCDLVVIRSAPDAVLIDLVKECALDDLELMQFVDRSKLIGRYLGQSLLLYMGRLDGRYVGLFLHPESARYIGKYTKYDPSTNTVELTHRLVCPMVTIRCLAEPRPLVNP